MEHKIRLWRKQSPGKTISISKESDLSFLENAKEKERALEFQRSLKDLNEQLSCALTESNVKDDQLAKQAKVVEQAISGLEKAETEVLSFKQDLDVAVLQKEAAEERIMKIDASLKECMQQLHVLQEEKQNIISDAAKRISREQEKARIMEERLAETNKRLTKSGAETINLTGVLNVKEKLIEELMESKARSESNFTAIVARLDSSEKINSSLKYEVSMLQKELEIRNEEKEFNLKSSDAAHKQHLENIKKISKLEKECQRLRIMVKKRLPGPATLAKMRSEVEILNSATATRSKNSNPRMEGHYEPEYCDVASAKSITSLISRLHAYEDENKIIKETLTKKNSELYSSQVMFARTASKLSQAETQLEELKKGQTCPELAKNSLLSYDLPLGSISEDGRNEDIVSCTESWASALISELEHFKAGKLIVSTSRTSTASDLSLMDDFIEMEKLAMVCMNKPFENSSTSSRESNTCLMPKEIDLKSDLDATSMELVPVNSISSASEANHIVQTSRVSFDKHPVWLQDILKVILQKHRSTQRSLDAILEEVKGALGKTCPSVKENSSDGMHFRDSIFQISQFASLDSFNGALLTNDNEIEARVNCSSTETKKANSSEEFSFDRSVPLLATSSVHISSQMEDGQSKLNYENKRLKHEILAMESEKKDMEERLESASAKNESLVSQLEESKERIAHLQVEFETLKESKRLIENQMDNQKLINEELGTQLTVVMVELNDIRQKFSALEVELEEKGYCCDELESTCLELQLQLESVAAKEFLKYEMGQEQKQLRTDWEVSAASKKLAECQETILNLGIQLKSLASPRAATLSDKVMSTPAEAKICRRPQLLDHIRAEYNAEAKDARSPKTKEFVCSPQKTSEETPDKSNDGLLYGKKFLANNGAKNLTKTLIQPLSVKSSERLYDSDEPNKDKTKTNAGTLPLIPKRQKGGLAFLRKLLLRRKKESSKKPTLPVGS